MLLPMTDTYAGIISAWTYPNEYAVYSFTQTDETITELMNGGYYAYLDGQGRLTGFFCFGPSARIPTGDSHAYAEDALDIGLGMRPDLCGQGSGTVFVQAGLKFAASAFAPKRIRLTVAAFNMRAIRTYEKLGFQKAASITHQRTQQPFYVMIYTEL